MGLSSISVHDIPAGTSCDGSTWPPISYVCGVDLAPRRNWCGFPVLPLVRAILSWEIVPDPDSPDQAPIWGDVHECHVQIKPRRFIFKDLAAVIGEDAVLKLPPYLLQEVPSPIPDPGPLTPLQLPELAKLYSAKTKQGQRTRSAAPFRVAAPRGRGARRRADGEVVRRTGPGGASAQDRPLGDPEAAREARPATRPTRSSSASGWTTTPTSSSARSGSSGRAGSPAVRAPRAARSTWPTGPTSAMTARTPTSAPSQVKTHDYDRLPDGGLCYAAPLPGRPRRSSAASAAPRSSVAYAPSCPGARRRRPPTRTLCRTGATASTCTCSCGPVSPTTGPRGSRSWAAWLRLRSTWPPGLTLPGAAIAENGYPLPNDCPFAGVVTLPRSARPCPRRPALPDPGAQPHGRRTGHRPDRPVLRGQLARHRLVASPRAAAAGLRGRAGWATPPASSGTSHRAATTSGRSSSRCSGSAWSTCGGSRWTTRSTRRSSSATRTTRLT